MSRSILKVLKTLHIWGGLTLALLFIVVSFTGTLLVWKSAYLWLSIPEARVEFTPTPQSLALIGESIDNLFDAKDIISIQFATTELPLTYVILADGEYAYIDTTGKIVDQWQGNGRVEEWIYDLHHRLLLEDFGLTVVGFAAMAMVLLVLLGLISFWPHRKAFRQGVVPHDLSRIQLLKTHRNIGVMIGLPFLLTLVTGVVLVFPAQTESLLLEDHRMTAEYSDAMVVGLDSIVGEGSGDWLPALERAQAVFPGAIIRSAQVPAGFSGYRIIGLQQADEWNRQGTNFVYIDAFEGYMDIKIDAANFPAIERAYNTAYPLHTGKINSLLYKMFLTLVGIGVFTLSSIGLFSYIKKFFK